MFQVTNRTRELEQETLKWQNRWEESTQALKLMKGNHEKLQGELVSSEQSLEKMTGLCRALQNERKGLLEELKAKQLKEKAQLLEQIKSKQNKPIAKSDDSNSGAVKSGDPASTSSPPDSCSTQNDSILDTEVNALLSSIDLSSPDKNQEPNPTAEDEEKNQVAKPSSESKDESPSGNPQ